VYPSGGIATALAVDTLEDEMAKLRWGADAPEDTESARTRLLDAAERCFTRFGVAKTTVEDVAKEARVSRATVYRYFDGRDALVLGVLLRQAGRFLGRLEKRLAAQSSFAESVVEGVMFTVDAVRADPHLAMLFTPESAGLTESIVGASDALFSITGDFLRPYFEAAQASGQLRGDLDADDAAEWILRCIVSMLTVAGPRRRTKAEQRQFLMAFLVPALADTSAHEATTARRRRRD
jgi:AcrR family transcriptional regulator